MEVETMFIAVAGILLSGVMILVAWVIWNMIE